MPRVHLFVSVVCLGFMGGCTQVRESASSTPEQVAAAILAAEPAIPRTLSTAMQRWNAAGRNQDLRWARVPGSGYTVDLASISQTPGGIEVRSKGAIEPGHFKSVPTAAMLESRERYDCAGNMTALGGALYDAKGTAVDGWPASSTQVLVRLGSLAQAKERFLCG